MPTRRRRPRGARHLDPLKWIEDALQRRTSNVRRYERMMRSRRRRQRLKSLLQRWRLRLRSMLAPWDSRRRQNR